MKIGILTSGGDCQGLNATVRAFCQSVFQSGANDKIYGFINGYTGLIQNQWKELTSADMQGLLTEGGTFLGSIRQPFKLMTVAESSEPTKLEKMKDTYKKLELDCLVTLGGAGTHKTAALLSAEGCNVIGLPKTIDNDIYGTEYTFGFQSAVEIVSDCIDRIRTTAKSHSRAMFVEVMGNKVGWLTLYGGMAGGADFILIPEIPFNEDKIVEAIKKREKAGQHYHMIAIAEGAMSQAEAAMPKKDRLAQRAAANIQTITESLAKSVEEKTGVESRATVLGYLQRGGSPCAFDRALCTKMGCFAYDLMRQGKFGITVATIGGKITYNALADIAGKQKSVTEQEPLLMAARRLGVSFGD